MLSQFHEARTLLRGHTATPAATIEFAVPHTLSLTYFPRWLQRIEHNLLVAIDRPPLVLTHLPHRLPLE